MVVLLQYYVDSPALCLTVLNRQLHQMSISQHNILLYWIYGIMLIESEEQEMTNTFVALLRVVLQQVGDKSYNVSGLDTSLKFLVVW